MSDEAEYEALPQRKINRRQNRRRGETPSEAAAAEQHAAVEAVAVADSREQPISHSQTQLIDQINSLSISHRSPTHTQQEDQPHTSMPDMPVYKSAAVGHYQFEYLDHTADVQLHAWGSSLRDAFEQVGLAMFNYMTPIDDLVEDEACTRHISVSGHDLHSLLFAYLDELLFVYATEYIMMKDITINSMDTDSFTLTATGRGEKFDRHRHECGTEVKAITYSAMQIREEGEDDAEVFVIVDI